MLICQPGEIMHVLLSSNFPWLFTVGVCFSIPGFTAFSRNLSNWIIEVLPVSKNSISPSFFHPYPEASAFCRNICEHCTWRTHYMETSKITCLESKMYFQKQTKEEINHIVIYNEWHWGPLFVLGKGEQVLSEICHNFITNLCWSVFWKRRFLKACHFYLWLEKNYLRKAKVNSK